MSVGCRNPLCDQGWVIKECRYVPCNTCGGPKPKPDFPDTDDDQLNEVLKVANQ